MLSKALLEVNFLIIQAPGDADVAIVTRAVEYGRRTQTVLARNDTNFKVPLCYNADLNECYIFSSRNIKLTNKQASLEYMYQESEAALSSGQNSEKAYSLFIHYSGAILLAFLE